MRRQFNWTGLVSAALLAFGSSLFISVQDNQIDNVEFVRAALQTLIAVAAFLSPPTIPTASPSPPTPNNENKKRVP